MNDRKRTLGYNREIQRYLLEIKELCLQPAAASDLLSLDHTERIREDSLRSLNGKSTRRIVIDFEQKKTIKFKDYVAKLHDANPHPVYVWTERSNQCGLHQIHSLLEFNFDFRFDVNEQGIIVLLASDLTDNLVLDFSYNERLSRYDLVIDVLGDHWSAVVYP